MTKLLRAIEAATKAVRCPHRWDKWQDRPIPAGCSGVNSWTRKCTKCGMRETVFRKPRGAKE